WASSCGVWTRVQITTRGLANEECRPTRRSNRAQPVQAPNSAMPGFTCDCP
ncbi:MAG: hypothetical protein AVDCRST_MAG64-3674, partial [uncultured Phycisphaerae bacterium]